MKRIILKPGEEKRIYAGHPWVYDNEVAAILDRDNPVALVPGELADVESADKKYVGRALVNPQSTIIARLYSRSKEGVDKGFFKRRIRESISKRFMYNLFRESARIVFAEADFLPGLIIDRFVGWSRQDIALLSNEHPCTFDGAAAILGQPSSWLSVQFLSYGMDCRREEILDALDEVLSGITMTPTGIVEKSGVKVREYEGLPLREGIIRGTVPDSGMVIFENGFPLCVYLNEGQKTGYFLDQKENRLGAARFAAGKKVLDLCCYSGGFAIHAARFGAAEVTAVDVSADALALVQDNARLNQVTIKTVEADVFDIMRAGNKSKERFDMIILDPPAFAKTHSVLDNALRGYKEINLQALQMLNPGGILVSCSCSQAVTEYRFKQMIASAAFDAGCQLVQLDFRYQSPDHPVLIGYDESLYLKCGFYLKIGKS
jgi:23S rRNA (cytosine1962-C5)-methyltransferase